MQEDYYVSLGENDPNKKNQIIIGILILIVLILSVFLFLKQKTLTETIQKVNNYFGEFQKVEMLSGTVEEINLSERKVILNVPQLVENPLLNPSKTKRTILFEEGTEWKLLKNKQDNPGLFETTTVAPTSIKVGNSLHVYTNQFEDMLYENVITASVIEKVDYTDNEFIPIPTERSSLEDASNL